MDLHGNVSETLFEACDLLTSIPMTGTASSLNAASAGSIVLYELQRRRGSGRPAAGA